jgi:hypothetical protein
VVVILLLGTHLAIFFLSSLNVEFSKVLEELSRDDSTRDHPKYRKNTPISDGKFSSP